MNWQLRSVAVAALAMAAVPVLAQSAARQAAPTGQRPASDFAQLPFMSGPELSPDGKQLAAKIAVDGKQILSIRNLLEKDRPVAYINLGETELLSWNWVNDNWLVIRIGSAQPVEGDIFYITRVAGVSADGKTIKPIAFKEGGQGADVIWIAHDGSPRILMSMQKSIYLGNDFWPVVSEVDVSTGRSRPVVAGVEGVMRWYADPAGTVRMGIGYNDSNRSARLLYRPSAKAVFRTVDRANFGKGDSLTVPLLTNDPAATSWTISGHEGFDALYELDAATLGIGKRVYGVAGYDIDGITRSEDGSAINGVVYTTDHARVHWLDPALAQVQADIDKAVAPRAAQIVSMSRDQKKLVVLVADSSQPGSYYYHDTAAGAMQRFAYVNEAIKSERLGPVSVFRYKARDGMSIAAVLTLPKSRPAKALPLIVMPHGGPEARDTASYDWWAQFLADRGYAVVQPNYRGSTGYGKALQEAGDGQWGLKMQDDLNDVVDQLASQGTVDPKRVCIAGASYGGYAALRGAQRDGNRYRCAISYAGVSDLNGMIRYDGRFLNANSSRAGWKQSAPDLKAVSPVNLAAEFSTPVLIMHGKKDLRVPVAQSRRMVERLQQAGKSVEYVEQPLGDHHFSRQADRQQFLETMEAFLRKHNPA